MTVRPLDSLACATRQYHRVTSTWERAVCRALREGHSLREVAAAGDVSYETVRRVAEKNGVTR